MWLIVIGIATVIASAFYFLFKDKRKKYRLGLLALILLGTFIMVLIDHLMAFFETGVFIETTTDGLIKNSALLGIAMVLAVLIAWGIAVVMPRIKKLVE